MTRHQQTFMALVYSAIQRALEQPSLQHVNTACGLVESAFIDGDCTAQWYCATTSKLRYAYKNRPRVNAWTMIDKPNGGLTA